MFSGISGMGAKVFGGGAKLASQSGRDAWTRAAEAADRLENFRPIRYTSYAGTAELTPEGLAFRPTDEYAGFTRSTANLFGRALSAYEGFDPSRAASNTLDLLRSRRASAANTNLSRLESRLLSQGRLGIGTGDRASNPELAGFFGAEAMADLEAQLAAEEEARAQGAYLYGQAAATKGLFDATVTPASMATLFTASDAIMTNQRAGAQARVGGAGLALQGGLSAAASLDKERGYLHDVGMKFMDMWGGGNFSSPMGSSGGGGKK